MALVRVKARHAPELHHLHGSWTSTLRSPQHIGTEITIYTESPPETDSKGNTVITFQVDQRFVDFLDEKIPFEVVSDDRIRIPGEPSLPFQVRKYGEIVGPGFNALEDAIDYVRSVKRADIRFEIFERRKRVWPP